VSIVIGDVLVHQHLPEHWREVDAEHGVMVTCMYAAVDRSGRRNVRGWPAVVDPDVAFDLSHQAEALVTPLSGDLTGWTSWSISVLGFIEADALVALETVVCAVHDGKLPIYTTAGMW
jgi:hypothetical protein